MNKDIAIKVENLSKVYKLYNAPIDRMKEALNPFKKSYHKEFYALNDVSFEIKKGEIVGIIGKNGSGKSTLLKIITGVLTPTTGKVTVNGRISALLELGAGFNPEYTGIENIYFQGNLMGLDRIQMDKKLQEILEFADIGDFIHQPVKNYSSGMFARLAFSVAINVDPDVLIVDEALSVGDALFQKKCFQKMEQYVTQGNTLIFVSHDQESVRTLTKKAVLLKKGNLICFGNSSDVVLEYRKELHQDETDYLKRSVEKLNNKKHVDNNQQSADANTGKEGIQTGKPIETKRSGRLSFGDLDAEVLNVSVFNENMEEWSIFYPKEKVIIVVDCIARKKLKNLGVAIRIRNKEGLKIYSWGTLNQDMAIYQEGVNGKTFWQESFNPNEKFSVAFHFISPLATNLYEIQATVTEEETPDYMNQRILHWKDEAAFFQGVVSMKENFFGGAFDLNMSAKFYRK